MIVAIYPDIIESCTSDYKKFADLLTPFMQTTKVADMAFDSRGLVLESYSRMVATCKDARYVDFFPLFMKWIADFPKDIRILDLDGEYDDDESLFCELASKLHPNHYLSVNDEVDFYGKVRDKIVNKGITVLDPVKLYNLLHEKVVININTTGDHSPITIGDNNKVG